jgi:hypothetical protein
MNTPFVSFRRDSARSVRGNWTSTTLAFVVATLWTSTSHAQIRPCPPPTTSVDGGQPLASTCTPTSGDILFAMDYSAAAAPNAGWGYAVPEASTWRRTRLESGGPNGRSAYRITEQYANAAMNGGDFYYGWRDSNLLQLQPAGQSRFYRIRWKFSADTNFNGRDQGDGTPLAMHRNKLLIVGDATSIRNARVIPAFQGNPYTRSWNMVISKDGGDDLVTTREYTTLGVWHDIQIEIKYSSATGVLDGYYKVWIDNNNYSSPTIQRVGIVVNRPPDSNSLVFGYMNNGLVSGAVYEFEHADFQIAATFDPAWNQ